MFYIIHLVSTCIYNSNHCKIVFWKNMILNKFIINNELPLWKAKRPYNDRIPTFCSAAVTANMILVLFELYSNMAHLLFVFLSLFQMVIFYEMNHITNDKWASYIFRASQVQAGCLLRRHWNCWINLTNKGTEWEISSHRFLKTLQDSRDLGAQRLKGYVPYCLWHQCIPMVAWWSTLCERDCSHRIDMGIFGGLAAWYSALNSML